jgi:short-subunit dehydrogenase
LPVMAKGTWRGKWALVTGAISGIGAELVAEELATGGAHVGL